jgi:hypothetical protein
MLALVILFVLLSPGFLLSIPPVAGRYFSTGKTSTTAVLVHAVVFGIVLYLLRNYYPQVLAEGFASNTSAQPLAGLSLGGGADLTRNGLGVKARAAAKANLGKLQGAVGTAAAAKLGMAK